MAKVPSSTTEPIDLDYLYVPEFAPESRYIADYAEKMVTKSDPIEPA